MAAVTAEGLILAIKCLRFIIDKGTMRSGRMKTPLPLVELVHLEISENLCGGLEAASSWLEIAENYGSVIGAEVHKIGECRSYVEGKFEAAKIFRKAGVLTLEFDNDDLRAIVSAERYLDRTMLLQESDSRERKNKARPKGGWKKSS